MLQKLSLDRRGEADLFFVLLRRSTSVSRMEGEEKTPCSIFSPPSLRILARCFVMLQGTRGPFSFLKMKMRPSISRDFPHVPYFSFFFFICREKRKDLDMPLPPFFLCEVGMKPPARDFLPPNSFFFFFFLFFLFFPANLFPPAHS